MSMATTLAGLVTSAIDRTSVSPASNSIKRAIDVKGMVEERVEMASYTHIVGAICLGIA